ncbi:MAG: urea carboxylase-associated family protein [Pseudomonadota bacterium]
MDWVTTKYRRNGDLDGINPSLGTPISAGGVPVPGERYTVPARQGRAIYLAKGETLRIINVRGSQVCDFWAFCDDGLHEFMSMEHVRASLSKTIPALGDELVTNRRRPILAFTGDSSPGVHDTLIAACDLPRYRTLGVTGYHDNCTDNLRMAVAAIGRHVAEIPAPLNIWMNNPIAADGRIGWLPPVAKAGDFVTFAALIDCVVVMSACPQDLVPVNGNDCMPTELAFEVLAAA